MRDVFISHADEDGDVALALVRGLNAAGYSTWCYEEDSDPGMSYLAQIDEELEATQAVVLVISASSLASGQVLKEVVRAHEAGKPFIPLRRGVPHEAVHQQRDWRMALGGSVSIAIPDDGVEAILPRVLRGLERSGVRPGGAARAADSSGMDGVAPPQPLSPERKRSPASPVAAVRTWTDRRLAATSPSMRIGITTVVGLLGVIGTLVNALAAMNPDPQTATFYRIVPMIGTANLYANLAGVGLNAALVYHAWRLYSGQRDAGQRIRLVASVILISIVVWFVVVALSALFPPGGRLRVEDRLSVFGSSVLLAAIAIAPAALVRALFPAVPSTTRQAG